MQGMVINNHLEYWAALAETAGLQISKNDTCLVTYANLLVDDHHLGFSLKDKLLNSVLYFCDPLKENECLQALDLICEFKKNNQPLCWWLGPDSSTCIRETLLNHLQYHGQLAGVYAKTFSDIASIKLPQDVKIILLSTEAEFDDWIHPLDIAHGLSLSGKKKYLDIFKELFNVHPDLFAHFIAYQEDQPIACSSVFFGKTAAGLYNRASLPTAPRHCLRLAMHYMILYELDLAYQKGYEFACSQTSPRMLKASRLGFKSAFEYEIYVSQE
jgi:hypothetical protein